MLSLARLASSTGGMQVVGVPHVRDAQMNADSHKMEGKANCLNSGIPHVQDASNYWTIASNWAIVNDIIRT